VGRETDRQREAQHIKLWEMTRAGDYDLGGAGAGSRAEKEWA
jgi:hypothetical protein